MVPQGLDKHKLVVQIASSSILIAMEMYLLSPWHDYVLFFHVSLISQHVHATCKHNIPCALHPCMLSIPRRAGLEGGGSLGAGGDAYMAPAWAHDHDATLAASYMSDKSQAEPYSCMTSKVSSRY